MITSKNSSDMESTASHKEKQDIIEKPIALTKSEIESLRQEMKKAGEIAKAYFSK
jgi:hypothetical protein